MAKAQLAAECIVSAENKVGALEEVFSALARENVNVRAYTAYVDGSKGFIKFVPSDADGAMKVLDKAGYSYTRSDVVTVEVPDRIGAGAEIAGKIAAAGINIGHSHASASGAGNVLLVFNTDDNAKAMEAINS